MLTVSTVGGSKVLKELILRVSTLGEEVVVLKEVILTISTLGRKWWS